MEEVIDEALIKDHKPAWEGGDLPYKASYGKLMMWFFLITDTLTFSGLLVMYGFNRFAFKDSWPIAEEVFTHFPFMHGDNPLIFVALMTFILIMSSVTMVLAVNYGHKMQKQKVILWLVLTIIGGCLFLGSQAWEWGHFIHGDKGGIQTKTNKVVHIASELSVKENKLSSVYELMGVDSYDGGHHFIFQPESEGTCSQCNTHNIKDPAINANLECESCFNLLMIDDVVEQIEQNKEFYIRLADRDSLKNPVYLSNSESISYLKNNGKKVLIGAGLEENEYGNSLFGDCFFVITGFHGFHVFSGVVLLIIILINVIKGTYEKRGHYEMVEKVGLYWHFVDLVWVFVFTFFYLV